MLKKILLVLLILITGNLVSQSFFFGADMSFVNEMEDCGVVYRENNLPKDPYDILADHGGNLVRLRLWHTPSWYDSLNDGKRYCDLADVRRAIIRAKDQNLSILLDLHLSDSWADPHKQLVPDAWLSVVDEPEILKDSLYQYIFNILVKLDQDGLLPEMIQVGNETNKGILLSPGENQQWTLDWERNAALFIVALKAVNDFEKTSGKEVKTVLHIAGPANTEWLVDGFVTHRVTNFDIIGISYYWAWHKPTTIKETGDVIKTLRKIYPGKQVMIMETGYIWTTENNDKAANIISETHPDYRPASPENQKKWLTDLTEEVMNSGGTGVIYWEPFWVSSSCFTPWGQGSHQEHATYFDFSNNLIIPGGIEWMEYDYSSKPATIDEFELCPVQIMTNNLSGEIRIRKIEQNTKEMVITVSDDSGNHILGKKSKEQEVNLDISDQPYGMYYISVEYEGQDITGHFLYSDI